MTTSSNSDASLQTQHGRASLRKRLDSGSLSDPTSNSSISNLLSYLGTNVGVFAFLDLRSAGSSDDLFLTLTGSSSGLPSLYGSVTVKVFFWFSDLTGFFTFNDFFFDLSSESSSVFRESSLTFVLLRNEGSNFLSSSVILRGLA
ncbi:hypothetical protein OGAPHI_004218 [Ogataea philodendri]|uniref:Uncharacterized protein n=1 Tax=Ogataea philodendri TaxID=1378263 RepID=A0A9P8P7E1_9ASCO|nr:uncharacterized protein OGAPHI_004218 [Ogataea philodendri]KAH3666029.1 hypothetical protein OGAPHI_004218 [Ogataea philodendri]